MKNLDHFFTQVIFEIKKHLFEYLLLATAGVFFLFLMSFFKGDRSSQFVVMVVFTAFYLLWSFIHHSLHKTLRLKIVVEYILIAALCLLLLEIMLVL